MLRFIFLAQQCSKANTMFLVAVKINQVYVSFYNFRTMMEISLTPYKMRLFQVSKIEGCTFTQSEAFKLPFSFRFGGCGTYHIPDNKTEGVSLCFGQAWRDQCYWTEDVESNQWTNIGMSHCIFL